MIKRIYKAHQELTEMTNEQLQNICNSNETHAKDACEILNLRNRHFIVDNYS
jgi:hypothetical protein